MNFDAWATITKCKRLHHFHPEVWCSQLLIRALDVPTVRNWLVDSSLALGLASSHASVWSLVMKDEAVKPRNSWCLLNWKIIFYFHPYLGKWSKLTSIFFNWVETTNKRSVFTKFPCFLCSETTARQEWIPEFNALGFCLRPQAALNITFSHTCSDLAFVMCLGFSWVKDRQLSWSAPSWRHACSQDMLWSMEIIWHRQWRFV